MRFEVKDLRTKPSADALVLTYFAKQKPDSHPLWRQLSSADRRLTSRYFKSREFTGAPGQVQVVLRSPRGKAVLLGLGDQKQWNARKLVLLARRVVQAAKTEKAVSLALALEPVAASGLSLERLVQTVTENMELANYEFTQYRTKPESNSSVRAVTLLMSKLALPSAGLGVKIGQIVGEQTNLARNLGNMPGAEMTPALLAHQAQAAGRACGFKVEVLGRAEMKKFGMGAILGVAHGSAEEPKFIIMEYWGAPKKSAAPPKRGKPRPKGREAPYVFVGKGVTFDTGGLNLKPGKHMNDMHLDMLGGAAVIAALGAVARLKLPVNVVGLVPTVENMPGSAGYRPGDVLRGLSGKTIEVINTDAEGRVVLSDALTYAERYQPRLVVDVATLTGACAVALGLTCSGLMTPSSELQDKICAAGETSGDYVWPLPLWEEFEDEIKGTFGDVQNEGKSSPYGGAIHGGVFLWQFAKKYPWAHLDIAGPMKTVEGQYLSKGASGVGVRLLVELTRSSI